MYYDLSTISSHMNPFSHRYFFLFFLIVFSCSCETMDYYERSEVMRGHRWSHSNPVSGGFEIMDTLAFYNIYFVLRHTDAYRYNNIWVQVDLKGPVDSSFSQKLDFSLGSDAGGWEGTGMNDIWEVRKRLTINPIRFKNPGRYQYSIRQIMREDPLEHIMAAGLRVQKQPE